MIRTVKCNECVGSGRIGHLIKGNDGYRVLAYSKCLLCKGKGEVRELTTR